MIWVARRRCRGNGKDAQKGQQKAREAHDPIGPGPPGHLGEQAGKNGADEEAARGGGTEQTENHVLAAPRVVAAAKDGDGVGQQESRTDALHGTAESEENGAAVNGKAGEGGPQAEPGEPADEEPLVTKDVAETARDEDEGADGEGVSRGKPAHLAGHVLDAEGAGNDVLGHDTQGETGLSEELRGADDGDKEDFAGEGLGTFDAGFRVALEAAVVDMVVDAVVMVLVWGFRGCLPGCRMVRGRVAMWPLAKRRVVFFSWRHCCGWWRRREV